MIIMTFGYKSSINTGPGVPVTDKILHPKTTKHRALGRAPPPCPPHSMLGLLYGSRQEKKTNTGGQLASTIPTTTSPTLNAGGRGEGAAWRVQYFVLLLSTTANLIDETRTYDY